MRPDIDAASGDIANCQRAGGLIDHQVAGLIDAGATRATEAVADRHITRANERATRHAQ